MPETPSAQPGQPAAPGRAGYLSPEEQAKRKALDERADQGMNMGMANAYRRQQEQDAAANAAAAGGGYRMDADAMRAILPRWQSIADKLLELSRKGERLLTLRPPAEDEGSTMQIKAARAHAEAYLISVRAQRKYAQNYADALQAAIEKTEQQNQAAADTLNKHKRDH
ncbi:hypothetical protein [Amycolatopsis sp. NPDC059657]|uniref:hypothetical protein n=1 Tax=Amycolatopsis sp. NPDC059657 TaxID=3346899 RepID=UPI00366C3F3D